MKRTDLKVGQIYLHCRDRDVMRSYSHLEPVMVLDLAHNYKRKRYEQEGPTFIPVPPNTRSNHWESLGILVAKLPFYTESGFKALQRIVPRPEIIGQKGSVLDGDAQVTLDIVTVNSRIRGLWAEAYPEISAAKKQRREAIRIEQEADRLAKARADRLVEQISQTTGAPPEMATRWGSTEITIDAEDLRVLLEDTWQHGASSHAAGGKPNPWEIS
jgi:hypothetical protein